MFTLRENYRERSKKSQIFEIDLRIFLSTIFPGPGMDLPAARDLTDDFGPFPASTAPIRASPGDSESSASLLFDKCYEML